MSSLINLKISEKTMMIMENKLCSSSKAKRNKCISLMKYKQVSGSSYMLGLITALWQQLSHTYLQTLLYSGYLKFLTRSSSTRGQHQWSTNSVKIKAPCVLVTIPGS
uniref:Uncharacterized protein n=2 Tax=Arundo donax TaxID=35708 RepID=A0A0A9GG86_ARUDO